ncbi:MAG: ABC transporter substrate-binding protein [Oscillospiraceae bacterium]|nr:ABC transporter substrate-binding protein [Oscillospiraceae bacterium]
MKKIFALILSVAMVLTMVACGSKKNDDKITLNIGYMPNYGSLWAVTTAIEKGYFEEAGIEVVLYEFDNGPNIIAAMDSTSIDIGYIGHGAHKLCVQGHAKIFALSHISNGDAVIGGPNVKTLADLKGKKVGYNGGSTSEDILRNALAKAGLAWEDITAVEMEAANLTTAALSDSLDAVACWSPDSLKILDEWQGSTKLADNMTFADTNISLASWIVTSKYAEANADKILAFTKALYKAMDYAADGNYDEVAGYVSNQTKTDKAVAYAQRGDADWLTGKDVAAGAADGTVEAYYKTQQKGFLASGAVTAEVPVADYVML